MKREREKNEWWKNLSWIFALMGISILLYGILAEPVLNWKTSRLLKKSYSEISELNMANLDEEDEQILEELLTEKIGIAVVDQDFQIIYKSFERKSEGLLEKYYTGKLDQFREDPTIEIKKYKSFDTVRLRGLLIQSDRKYYILLRKELSGTGDLKNFSIWYFALAMLLISAFEWKMWQRRREQGNAELQVESGAMKAVQKEFVANISHELKTPLAVISSQVEMLQKMGDEIDREYYFESIREETDKMSKMVGKLLDLTIMEHKMERMELSEVDFSELMEYMLLKYDALLNKKGIHLKTQIEENCIVTGNRMYLEEAVNNYLMNAFQHTYQGKTICVNLGRIGKDACLEVLNQGEQIPEEAFDHIWESFYSIVGGTGKNEEIQEHNAGIGLFVVKNIVEQHHGSCGAENVKDGVRFWIRIPLRRR